jgi:succinate dehydrogenase / fumarate reductase cytochrome b subunit
MTWKEMFTSSIGKKLVMGFTGLFLITFLIVHVGINSCIFAMDGGVMFNKAAHFMGSTVLIRIAEIGLFLGLIIHIVQGLMLTLQNQAKRTSKYIVNSASDNSKWYSRSMGLLGTLLLFFLILHLSDFWVKARITNGIDEAALPNGEIIHDMFQKMKDRFSELWVVLAYVAGCISLGWHLVHGFHSAFRTVGVSSKKYLALIQQTGIAFSIIVSLAFAMMPIAMYFGWVK